MSSEPTKVIQNWVQEAQERLDQAMADAAKATQTLLWVIHYRDQFSFTDEEYDTLKRAYNRGLDMQRKISGVAGLWKARQESSPKS